MKVAIMGAGLSGLACAKYLEDHGVSPVIFERRHRVGERFPNMEAVMQIMHRPMQDPFVYMSKKYGIHLLPGGIMHTIEIYSPNKKTELTGFNIGYTTIRGNDERSLERQLAKQVQSEINFNSTVTWQELEKDFDKVIIATGDPTISMELGVWNTDTEAFLMGCIVKGKFDLGVSKMWVDQRLSKQCMVYFSPFDVYEASYCTVAIPSSPEELEALWFNTVEELNINPVPGTEFKFEEYKLGRVSTKEIGKIILTGAAAGFVEPFMGFGQIPSILSGVYAAISILTGKSYSEMTAWFDKQYLDCLTIRKYINKLDNKGFDRVVSLVDMPGVRNILANTNIHFVSLAAAAVRARNAIKSPLQ
ncbi:MAG: NAD(P)-binding protein [Clostridia bacterium]|nr:NAD(P)-binding protein [Clostridia bacterium]